MVYGGGFPTPQQVSRIRLRCLVSIHEMESGHTRTKPEKAMIL